MKCGNCGCEVENGGAFCPNCGSRLGGGSTPPEVPGQKGAGFSIASMVLGICALVFSCCLPGLTFLLALIGVVLAAVALHGKYSGHGMAVAGLVTSIIALVPAVIVLLTMGAVGILSAL